MPTGSTRCYPWSLPTPSVLETERSNRVDKAECTWNPAEHDDVGERIVQMAAVAKAHRIAYTEALGGAWTVMRYKDLMAVATDTERFSNAGNPRYGRGLPPLEVDPPEHGPFRKLLQSFFMPKRMRAIEPLIQQATTRLVDKLLQSERPDLARDFAYPMPVMGLCALLGVSDENWEDIKQRSEDSLLSDSDDPADRALAHQGHLKLLDYARVMVSDRRAHPRSPEEDIASALLALEVDGERVDDERVVGILRLLISAGHNSTTSGMGNILLYLAEHGDVQDALRADPDAIPLAIEELLRLETPVQEMPRTATRNTELHGCPIKAGDRIAMFWAAGNRDPEIFPDPGCPVLDRKPNRHLAFGYGIHTCIGAPLARLEMAIAIRELLSRTARFTIDGPVKRARFHRMGVASLPVNIVDDVIDVS